MKSTGTITFSQPKDYGNLRHGLLILMALSLTVPLRAIAAEPTAPPAGEVTSATPQEKPEAKVPPFKYVVEGRRDPFMPFVTEKAASSSTEDQNEIIEKDVVLSGMQLFEPGQLNLVALLAKGSEQFAMVEDSTGKGYVIAKGTKIGRRGIVVDIIPNKVLIEETAETRAGQKIVTEVVMVLKKEGEE